MIRFIRGLSLDITAGTYFSAEMARKAIAPDTTREISIIIVCIVYIIYVLDHIFDYKWAIKSSQPYKYSWFKKALYPIWISLCIVTSIAVIITFNIYSSQLLIFGLVTGVMVIGYYIFRYLFKSGMIASYPKEFIVAFVFTVGIWGYYLLQSQQGYLTVIPLTTGFFGSMLLNTHLFSYFEKPEDDRLNQLDTHNFYGLKKHRVRFTAIIFFGLIINTGALLLHYQAGIILMAMFLYQTTIYIFRNRILHSPYYGSITDAVLLFPLFYGLL